MRALSGMEPDVVVPTLLAMLDGGSAADARRALVRLGHRAP